MKQFASKIKSYFCINRWKDILFVLLGSWLTVILCELSQKNAMNALLFFIKEPFSFLLNFTLVLAISSFALLSRRILFSCLLIDSAFVLLSIVNKILFTHRGTPFLFSDLYVMKDGFAVIQEYLSWQMILSILIGIIILIFTLIILFKKAHRSTNSIKLRIFCWISLFLFSVFSYAFAWNHYGFLASKWDVQWDYQRNGFLTSFVNSYFSSHVQAPDNYTEDSVQDIIKSLSSSNQTENLPNIIFLQLESLSDISMLNNVVTDKDPLTNIHKYLQDNPHGDLYVPTYGGTTTRTEFEVLTSYNLDFMGNGTIPFNNGVLNKPVESLPYTLNKLGYTSTAIHNYQGDFYNRHIVYPNLGFHHFISLEMMNNVNHNNYWPKDDILQKYIFEAMDTTQGSDFIFTVAVSTHGTYPNYLLNDNHEVNVLSASNHESKIEMQNYVDLLVDVDKMVKEIVDRIMKSEEHTILVVYSDHLPKLMEHSQNNENDLYKTFYFMIDNRVINQKNQLGLESYQLASLALNQAQLPKNSIEQFHLDYYKTGSYLEDLRLLQYDQLYGQHYSLGEEKEAVMMEMGMNPLQINTLYQETNTLLIKGSNFTYNSIVYFDEQKQKTTFINETTLSVQKESKAFNEIQVRQVGGRYNTTYAQSNIIKYP